MWEIIFNFDLFLGMILFGVLLFIFIFFLDDWFNFFEFWWLFVFLFWVWSSFFKFVILVFLLLCLCLLFLWLWLWLCWWKRIKLSIFMSKLVILIIRISIGLFMILGFVMCFSDLIRMEKYNVIKKIVFIKVFKILVFC